MFILLKRIASLSKCNLYLGPRLLAQVVTEDQNVSFLQHFSDGGGQGLCGT